VAISPQHNLPKAKTLVGNIPPHKTGLGTPGIMLRSRRLLLTREAHPRTPNLYSESTATYPWIFATQTPSCPSEKHQWATYRHVSLTCERLAPCFDPSVHSNTRGKHPSENPHPYTVTGIHALFSNTVISSLSSQDRSMYTNRRDNVYSHIHAHVK
jgi:hypothetical protein